jgi:hypothetical protein
MNPIKIAEKIKSILALLRPLFFSIIGGLTVTTVTRCSDTPPVNLVVTNLDYENKLLEIQRKQDSIYSALPDINKSLRYLSERYPDREESKLNR